MMYLRGHGKSNSRTNKKHLSRMNAQELICRFLFIYGLYKSILFVVVRHLSINVFVFYFCEILIYLFSLKN